MPDRRVCYTDRTVIPHHDLATPARDRRLLLRRQSMPRTRKDVLTEFRTTEILQAAHRVFAEKGFDQATIADVAAAAGVAKGTVYLYYRSKREVYWAALRQDLLVLRDETRRQLEAAGTIEQKLRAFIAVKLRYFEQHRDFFRIYYSELGRSAMRHTQFQRQIDELYLEQAKLLEETLQQAARRKTARHLRPDATAFAVMDLVRGMIVQRLRGWSTVPLDDDVAFTFDLVWKGIGLR
jgi:AcrR family transcriptional regulator